MKPKRTYLDWIFSLAIAGGLILLDYTGHLDFFHHAYFSFPVCWGCYMLGRMVPYWTARLKVQSE